MAEFLGIWFALLAAFTWSSRDIFLKKGFVTINPLLGILANLATLFPVIFVYGLVTGEWSRIPIMDMQSLSFMAIGAVVHVVVGTSLFFTAIKVIGASRAGALVQAHNIIAVSLAIVFIHEEWSLGLLAGAVLVLVGAYTISLSMDERHGDVEYGNRRKGMLLAVAAAFVWGVGPLFFRIGLTGIGSPVWGTLITGITALIASLVIFSFLGILNEVRQLKKGDIRLLSATGILDSIGFAAVLRGLALSPVVHVIPVVSGRPLITVILSFLFIQHLERVNWKVFAGMILIITGVYLVIFT